MPFLQTLVALCQQIFIILASFKVPSRYSGLVKREVGAANANANTAPATVNKSAIINTPLCKHGKAMVGQLPLISPETGLKAYSMQRRAVCGIGLQGYPTPLHQSSFANRPAPLNFQPLHGRCKRTYANKNYSQRMADKRLPHGIGRQHFQHHRTSRHRGHSDPLGNRP